MVRHARLAVVAVSVLGLALALPAAAHADKPVCPNADLETRPGVALNLQTPTCTNVTNITGFTVTDPPNGTFVRGNPSVYTPDAGFHGLDQFTYTITDEKNGASDAATVRIIVDTAPTCSAASVTVPANVATVLPDLPCTDADDDVLDIFVDAPAHGTLSFGDTVVYTPTPGYSGPDSLAYYAEDEFFSSDDATLSITVAAPPPPVPTVRPTPAPLKDLSAPSLALKNASKKQALAISLTTNENASATLTATLDAKTARKLKLSRTVGTLKAALTPGTTKLSVKLSAKARKALKNVKTAKLTVTAVVTDVAGNKTTKTLAVTLKK